MIRRTLVFILIFATLGAAATDFVTRSAKASRFFAHHEWASAMAMYSLMLDERPDSAAIWAHAIVAAGMQQLPDQQIDLLTSALNHGVPIDSIFSGVDSASMQVGHNALYEQFLTLVKEREPWMERVVNLRLLNYYSWRDNGPGMVTMSEIMLAGLPDDERFLYTLARGKLLCSDVEGAIDVYEHIARKHPKSLEALLYLGNYYSGITHRHDEALGYLRRAYAIKPTPYIDRLIYTLSSAIE